MQTPEPVRRTYEIEDVTNLYLIHPIANGLTPLLAKLRVRPNAVSVAGMLFGILAGYAYFNYQDARFAIAGFILMIAWHVMDGTDGQLARLTRTQSDTGKILDGICDYVTFIAVYAGLALSLGRQHGRQVWILVLVAGACHAFQSAAYEMQRQDYDFWGWGRKSKAPPKPAELKREPGIFGLLHGAYLRLQLLAAGSGGDFHRRLEQILAGQPKHAAAIRDRYRAVFAKPVRRWSILSANYRTLGIFVCAVLKVPLFYFFFEIGGLSLILAALIHRQHARQARFLAELGTVN